MATKAPLLTRKLSGPHTGRTILITEPTQLELANGKAAISAMPRLVKLNLRPASSAPEGTRVKATLAVDGIPMPVAQATVLPLPIPALCVESRLEMN